MTTKSNGERKTPDKYVKVECEFCHGDGLVERINTKWLIAKRKESKKSLRQIARELGFSAVYICDIELGKRRGNAEIINFYQNL